MIQVTDKAECCGCGACQEACPAACIQMAYDSEGFAYPSVLEKACIGCGKCEAVCPVRHVPDGFAGEDAQAYGFIATDEEVLFKSSSGGAFYYIASQILACNGVVYGAELSDDCRSVRHTAVYSLDDLQKVQKSKYVQSEMGGLFTEIKDQLAQGKKVLFSGTPCQVGALKNYLGGDRRNLFTVDLACHGISSRKLWNQDMDMLEEKANRRIEQVVFRPKGEGCESRGVIEIEVKFSGVGAQEKHVGAADRTITKDAITNTYVIKDNYMKAFLNKVSLRPSCYSCRFRGTGRASDITLGDLWGVEHMVPEWGNGKKGASLLIVHSKNGRALFDSCLENGEIREVAIVDAVRWNKPLAVSPKMHPNRRKFFNAIDQMPFDEAVRLYATQRRSAKGWIAYGLQKVGLFDIVKKARDKKVVHRMVAFLAVMYMLFLECSLLNYLVYDDTHIYARTAKHEYNESKQWDALYLGASHCYVGINPQIIDGRLGIHSMNLSTSSQCIDETYALIQEAASQKDVKQVYCDISYSSAMSRVDRERRQEDNFNPQLLYIVGDYLTDPAAKFEFLLNATVEGQYDKTFFPARRNMELIFHVPYITNLWKEKHSKTYRQYQPLVYEKEAYIARGFVANYLVAGPEAYFKPPSAPNPVRCEPAAISPTWSKYLKKIIRTCEKNNMELVLINIPEPMPLLDSYGDYDSYIAYVNQLTEGTGVAYYNFNLLKEGVFADRREYFHDNNHLNVYGAERFSNILADVMAKPDAFKQMTYASFKEKLAALGYGEEK